MHGMRYQPQGAARLSATNPLVSGLVHSWAGVNAAGPLAVRDMAGRAHGVFGAGAAGSPSGNSWRVGPGGYYLNFDDSGTGAFSSINLKIGDANGSGSPGSNVFSLAFRVRLTGGGALYGGADGSVELQIGGNGAVTLVKQNTVAFGPSSVMVPFGVDVDIGLSYDGNTVNYYINGVPAGSASGAQTFVLAAQYYLGYANNGERVTNGTRIYRADLWNRVLPAAQFKAWSDNPWQIFRAANDEDEVVATAAPANTVVMPGAAMLAVTGFAPTVARGTTTNVSPGAAGLSVTGYAPSITQGLTKTISPAPASVAITGYAPDVSQTAARTTNPAPAALAITGFAPTVTRGVSLNVAAGAPAGMTLTGYAPTVTQANNVTPHMYDATIMRLSVLRAVADLGPDRLQ